MNTRDPLGLPSGQTASRLAGNLQPSCRGLSAAGNRSEIALAEATAGRFGRIHGGFAQDIAGIAFFNSIIGVFGLQAALVGLALFVAHACVLATRSQQLEQRR